MVDRAPLNRPAAGIEAPAEVFYRVKRSSSILGFLGLIFAFFLSTIFLLVGIVGTTQGEYLTMVFGLIGAAVLVICLRGAWSLACGPCIHVIAFELDQITWGYAGKEKVLSISEVASIHWSIDMDNELHLSLRKRDGKRVCFYYIDTLVGRKDRPAFLEFLRNRYAMIPLEETDHH